jgi:DNA-directed RNA polymerase subunit RPC12/RpoP
MSVNGIPPYKCGKCGRQTLYRDDDRLNDIKYIACFTCGNRYPPGPMPIKIEKSGLKGSVVISDIKDKGMEKALQINTEAKKKPLCKECGIKSTISAGNPYCASCLAKLSHKKRKRSESASKACKREEATGNQAKARSAPEEQRGAINIEFKSHVQILKEVEKLAEREMRPLDCQILYMLKRYIEAEVCQCPG